MSFILSALLSLILVTDVTAQSTYYEPHSAGISVTNNMARAITSIYTYLPSHGVSFSPQTINPGQSDHIELDLISLNWQTSVSGLILFEYAGSTNRIGIAWEIWGNANATKNNKIGVYWGNLANNTLIYQNMFNASSSFDPAMKMGAANMGWRVHYPSNNISIAAWLSTDEIGNSQLIIDEYNRIPQGPYYVQSESTGLYWKFWYDRLVYDYLTPSFPASYKWELGMSSVIEVFSTIRSTANYNAGVRVTYNDTTKTRPQKIVTPYDNYDNTFWYEFKHIEADIYAIRCTGKDGYFDGNNCEDAAGTMGSCAPGRIAGVTDTNNNNISLATASLRFRLIPVNVRDRFNATYSPSTTYLS